MTKKVTSRNILPVMLDALESTQWLAGTSAVVLQAAQETGHIKRAETWTDAEFDNGTRAFAAWAIEKHGRMVSLSWWKSRMCKQWNTGHLNARGVAGMVFYEVEEVLRKAGRDVQAVPEPVRECEHRKAREVWFNAAVFAWLERQSALAETNLDEFLEALCLRYMEEKEAVVFTEPEPGKVISLITGKTITPPKGA